MDSRARLNVLVTRNVSVLVSNKIPVFHLKPRRCYILMHIV